MPDTSQTVHLIHNFISELKKKSDARYELLETVKTVGRKKMIPNRLQYSQLPCFSYNA